MKHIAIIGAGGTGYALAADLTLAGLDAILFEELESKEKLDAIRDRGGIELTGSLGEHFVQFSRITTDIHEALHDADIILVAVNALRHERIAERCGPLLKDGQTIVIGPDNGGTLVFTDIFRRQGLDAEFLLAGLGGGFYPCRRIGPAKVVVGLPKAPKRIAAFPADKTGTVIERLQRLETVFKFNAGTNVVEMVLSSPNIPNHLAGTLLNASAVEQSGGDFYLYRQGLTPSVVKCIKGVIRERKALFDVLGFSIASSDFLDKCAQQGEFPALDLFRGLIGPTDLQHRYVTEEATTGLALMISLAEMVKVPIPITAALVTLASAINETDYLAKGRTVQNLGLSGLGVDELIRYLETGRR